MKQLFFSLPADKIIQARTGDQVATLQFDLGITPLHVIICDRCCRKMPIGVHLKSSLSRSPSAGIVICKECIDNISNSLHDYHG